MSPILLNITTQVGIPMMGLTKEVAKQMELKLNVSSKAQEYQALGDIIFTFAHEAIVGAEHVVSETVYAFLQQLSEKNNWEECRAL
jgi:hypothetical protein